MDESIFSTSRGPVVLTYTKLISMVDVFDEPRAVHLVLELCDGGELFDRIIEKGQYSEQDAASAVKMGRLSAYSSAHETVKLTVRTRAFGSPTA
eukprot:1101901-Prorocentrum_minimum.AAC.1